MNINKVFISGRMNKDDDERYLKNGDYRDATNIRVLSSESSDVGTVENVQGNERLTYVYEKLTNAYTQGGYADDNNEKIYYFVTSDEEDAIIEWDKATDTIIYVLEHTSLLNFSGRIKGVNLIDGILFWTDGINPPRCINIETAKSYGIDGFTEIDISVIKAPPLYPPTITLQNTISDLENNLLEKFLCFGYRYKFLDGQFSAISPFTPYAFMPTVFSFDFSTSANESMVNYYNQILIQFNTGNRTVTDIELLFKESGNSIVYVIDSFNKERLGYADDTIQDFIFTNNKIYMILPENEIYRTFDNVPLLANAQTSVENRIIYGDYTEHFNIQDCEQNNIEIDYSLDLVTNVISNLTPETSLKSNVDYEIGINYVIGDSRMSTTLTSKENTIFVPNTNSVKQNKIKVTLVNKPPCEATQYRFYIKQSKQDYDIIIPTLFYQDGVYVWVKLESSDVNKIAAGDYLIVKADSGQILASTVYTKVLEIAEKPRNFLEPDETELKQLAGNYYKLKPKAYRMNNDDFVYWEFDGYDNTRAAYDNPIQNDSTSIIENPVFYGVGLNDMSSSGTYSNTTTDKRFEVGIFSVGATDTFQWRLEGTLVWNDNTGSGYPFTTGASTLTEGITVSWIAITGHTLTDTWIISAKTAYLEGKSSGSNERNYAFGLFPSIVDDQIFAGSRIHINYDEYGAGTLYEDLQFISNATYDNLEEWYFKDEIATQIGDIDPDLVWFRRGVVSRVTSGDQNAFQIVIDTVSPMVMIIRTENSESGSSRAKISSHIDIFQSENLIIFETKPTNYNTDVFYEIGKTYDIINHEHQATDQNQELTPSTFGYLIIGKTYKIDTYVAGDNFINVGGLNQSGSVFVATGTTPTNWTNGSSISKPAVSTLDVFNCFSYGNGVESYKIKDIWNGINFKLDTKPSLVYNEFKKIRKNASLIYSGLYNKSTNVNNLNEFNLSTAIFKDLDDKFGNVGILYNDNGNILVIQQDATSQILYNKKILYDVQGVENVAASAEVLGSQQYHAGEYGISNDVHSFAVKGNSRYWIDSKRGCVIRLGGSGVEEISKFGMFDYFKDILKENTFTLKIGVYDPFYDEYICYIKTIEDYVTVAYNEVPKGFTSFYTYEPEFMINMNNDLYSFKDGELYIHHSNNVPRQQFYGERNDFDITLVVNEQPTSDKIFKTFMTESTIPFDIILETNYTNSTIYSNEFEKRESWYYADMRQSENDDDYTGFNANGIGEILAFNNYNKVIMMLNPIGKNISIGDTLWMQWNDNDNRKIGTIINIDSGNIFTDTFKNPLVAGKFIFATKNSRIEGSEIRGYYLEAKLLSSVTYPAELNGINVNTILSNV